MEWRFRPDNGKMRAFADIELQDENWRRSQVRNGVRSLADLGRNDLIGLGGFLSEVNESIPSAGRLPGSRAGAIRDRAVY